jgi:hypothetical protein
MSHGHDAHHDDHAVVKGSNGAPAGLKQTTSYSLGSPLIMDVKKGLWFGGIFSAGASLSACPQPSTPRFFFSLVFWGVWLSFALRSPCLHSDPAAQRPIVALLLLYQSGITHVCVLLTCYRLRLVGGGGVGGSGGRGMGQRKQRCLAFVTCCWAPARHARA